MEKHKEYEYLYVSLYGMTSYKEIEDSFFEQIHPVLSSKGMKIAGKIIKGLIKTTIKVDFDRDGKEDASVTSGVPDISLPDYLKNIDNKILVFDDLERCSIPISNILGYINQFVETNGLKVILIANEEEIIKASEKNKEVEEAKSYLAIKEKLIGKSFDVTTDFNSAIDGFISESNNSEVSQLISNNRELIKDLFDTAGYNNLRHLRQTILDLDRFYSFLSAKAKSHSELVTDLISLFFAISFEIRKGKIHEGDIPRLFQIDYFGSKEDSDKSETQKIREKYSVFGHYYFPISEDLWTAFFKYGFIKSEDVKLSIENGYYFKDEKTPDWIKLWYYFDLNDDDFEKVFQNVYANFESLSIDNKYEVVQITGLFISFCNINLIAKKKDTIIEIGKKNFDKLKTEKKLKRLKYEEFPSDASHGLGYTSLRDTDFLEFLSFATTLVNSSQEEDYPTLASDLLKKLIDSPEDFEEAITLSNSRNNLYYNVPILKYIRVDKFIEVYLQLPNKQKKQLAWTLEKRYQYSDFHANLKDELDWLNSLYKALDIVRLKNVRTVSSKIIEFTFLKSLKKAIDALQLYTSTSANIGIANSVT